MNKMIKRILSIAISFTLAVTPSITAHSAEKVAAEPWEESFASEETVSGDLADLMPDCWDEGATTLSEDNLWEAPEEEPATEDVADEASLPEETLPEETISEDSLSGFSLLDLQESTASENSIREEDNVSPYVTVHSGTEPKIQRLSDGTFVAMKGQKVLLGNPSASSDEKIIKAGKKKLGQAKKTGMATVTFGDGTQAEVSVVTPRLSTKRLRMSVGDSAALSVSAGGAESKGLKVAWMTSNPNVVQVAEGKVVAVGKGKGNVFALIGGKALKCAVQVADKPGSTLVLNAYTDGKDTKIPFKGAKNESWSVADAGIISIVKNSRILGNATGRTTVSGNTHNIIAYSNAPGAAMGSINLKVGEQALIRTGCHIFPIWKSKNPGIAAVSEWGYVIGESEGTTTVSAKIGKTRVKISVTVSGTLDTENRNEIEYPYVNQVIDAINGNEGVHIHYNDSGDYYLHSGDDAPAPVDGEVTGGEENGFIYDITPEGEAVIKEVAPDRIDGTNFLFRDYFSLEGVDGQPRFSETNLGKTDAFYYIENEKSVENLTAQIEAAGGKVAPDISMTRDNTYNWGVDTVIKDGRAVKVFRKLYTDPETGWIFYITGNTRAYIIAHDDLRSYENDPDSLNETDSTRRPGSDDKVPVDENSDPNLDPEKWNDGNSAEGDVGQKSQGWRRKHTDPDTGMVFILNDEKTEAMIVGANSPAADSNGNIMISTTVHKNALGGTYPVTGIMPDAFNNNSPAAEITVKGNRKNKKDVLFSGNYVKTGEAADGSFVYKRFFDEGDVCVLVEKSGNTYSGTVIGASAEADKITIPASISLPNKDVKSVPVKLVMEDAFNGKSGYVPENAWTLFADIPWATIRIQNESQTKRGAGSVEYGPRSATGDSLTEYFWEKLPDGSYRQMFIDAKENPASTGNRDTGATGYVFYVSRSVDGTLRAVITGYDIDNADQYKYAPDGSGALPLWVNKTGTMVKVYDAAEFRYTVTFDATDGTCDEKNKAVYYGAPYGRLPEPANPKENAMFTGWSLNKTGTGSAGERYVDENTRVTTGRDHTLYAHWKYITESSMQVIFDPNGGKIDDSSKAIIKGHAYGTLPEPKYDGYSFDGWYTDRTGGSLVTSSTIVEGDKDRTLYAHWTINTIDVTFDANGGSFSDGKTSTNRTVIYKKAYGELPDNISKKGFAFAGWYTEETGGARVTASTTVTATKAHTLYAHWNENKKCTVTFNANGGECDVESKTVTYGLEYGTLPSPKYEGHSFNGWFTSKTGGAEVTATSIVTSSNAHTIYAHWTSETYTVSLKANGGTCTPASISVTFGKTYGELPVPERSKFKFLGWFTELEDGDLIEETTKVTKTKAHSLYAHWEAIPEYTVKLNPCGGTCSKESITVLQGGTYGTLPKPTYSGQEFGGWYTGIEGSDEKITEFTKVTKERNHTLYAFWTSKLYNITLNPNGGSCDTASVMVASGQPYGALPTPKRTSYEFLGWFTSSSGGTQVTENSVLETPGNKTLYAHWSYLSCTVTFDVNHKKGTLGTQEGFKTVAYEDTYGTLPTPSAPGQTFVGWFTAKDDYGTRITADSKVRIQSNHTLYAHWTDAGYTVTLDPNGGTCETKSITVVYNTEYGDLPEPSWPGHIFQGWYTAASGGSIVTASHKFTSTQNQTLYAHWSSDGYILTLDPNGGTCSDKYKTIYYERAYGYLPTPEKTGYKFDGWHTSKTGGNKVDSSTIHDKTTDVTVYAHWSGKEHTVYFNVSNGGSCATTSKKVTVGSTYGELPTPTFNGHTFSGWFTKQTGGTKVTSTTAVAETDSNETLYAQWDNAYVTVTFDAKGGTCSPATTRVQYNYTYGQLPIPSRKGYDFKGWAYNSTDYTSNVNENTVVTKTVDHTLYAIWEGKTISVIFDENGGQECTKESYPSNGTFWYGQPAMDHHLHSVQVGSPYSYDPERPSDWWWPSPEKTYSGNTAYWFCHMCVRDGYTFAGWFTSPTGGTEVTPDTIVTNADSPHYLYAHWTKDTPKTYTVTFNANGGSVSTKSKTVTGGSMYGSLPTPNWDAAHKFDGWYTAASGGSNITATTTVSITSDQTLYAHWTVVTFGIKVEQGKLGKVRVYNKSGGYSDYWTGATSSSSISTVTAYPGCKVVIYADKSIDDRITDDKITWKVNSSSIGTGIACHFTVPSSANGQGSVGVGLARPGSTPALNCTVYTIDSHASGWGKNVSVSIGE